MKTKKSHNSPTAKLKQEKIIEINKESKENENKESKWQKQKPATIIKETILEEGQIRNRESK